jgi:hypothetical protein
MLSEEDKARIEAEEQERAQILRDQAESRYRAAVRAEIAERAQATGRGSGYAWGVVALIAVVLAAVYYFETR